MKFLSNWLIYTSLKKPKKKKKETWYLFFFHLDCQLFETRFMFDSSSYPPEQIIVSAKAQMIL